MRWPLVRHPLLAEVEWDRIPDLLSEIERLPASRVVLLFKPSGIRATLGYMPAGRTWLVAAAAALVVMAAPSAFAKPGQDHGRYSARIRVAKQVADKPAPEEVTPGKLLRGLARLLGIAGSPASAQETQAPAKQP